MATEVLPEVPRILRELTTDERRTIVERGAVAMSESWKDAEANTPQGMAFVRGGLYRLKNSVHEWFNPDKEYPQPLYSFYVGTRVVTKREYAAIMGSDSTRAMTDGDGDLPVTDVSAYEAIAYCNKRSVTEGLKPAYRLTRWGDGYVTTILDSCWRVDRDYFGFDPDADGYRLPDERHWEYAAREAGSVEEWVDEQIGSYECMGIRGSASLSGTPVITNVGQASMSQKAPGRGFRVMRPIAFKDRRFEGLVFSDQLRARSSPLPSAPIVDKLSSLAPVAVYEVSGSGERRADGILDVWFRIGEGRWVNAQYVAVLPFFTRSTGRIDSYGELALDVTDCADIRETAFQFHYLDGETRRIRSLAAGDDVYYSHIQPLYGIPVAKRISDVRPYFSEGKRQISAKTCARFVDDWDYYEGGRIPDCQFASWRIFNRRLFIDTFEESDLMFDVVFDSPQTVTLVPDGNASQKESYALYSVDERTLMIYQMKNEHASFSLLRSNLPYYASDFVKSKMGIDPSCLLRYNAKGQSFLAELIYSCYDSAEMRVGAMWPLAKSCVEKGVPVNYADYDGMTALHYAAKHWDDGLIEYLLRHGANPRFKNLDGEYPVHLVTEAHWNDNPGTESATRKLLLVD